MTSSINIQHSPAPAAATTSNQPSLLVFSGGTAFNGVVEELKKLTTSVAHVLPVSDDGGSTAEIVRVLGGPAVGDIRSRCLRLSDQSTSEALAVRTLLGFRLPLDAQQAKLEW
ncbi:maternal effect embryo arrest 18 [Tanacetum coccineum]